MLSLRHCVVIASFCHCDIIAPLRQFVIALSFSHCIILLLRCHCVIDLVIAFALPANGLRLRLVRASEHLMQ